MYSVDVAYAGAPVDAVAAGGAAPKLGFRVVPVLAAGATQEDLRAAYADLRVRITKQTENFRTGTTEELHVAGPDWHTQPALGRLEILAGLSGVTYRVWVATDCKEMEFVDTPVMAGFPGGGAAPGGSLETSAAVQHAAALGTKPAAAGDGVDLAGAKAYRVIASPVTAGAAISATGFLEAYVRIAALATWTRCPDLDLQVVAASAADESLSWAAVEVRMPAGARIAWRPNGMAVTAGTDVNLRTEVLR